MYILLYTADMMMLFIDSVAFFLLLTILLSSNATVMLSFIHGVLLFLDGISMMSELVCTASYTVVI